MPPKLLNVDLEVIARRAVLGMLRCHPTRLLGEVEGVPAPTRARAGRPGKKRLSADMPSFAQVWRRLSTNGTTNLDRAIGELVENRIFPTGDELLREFRETTIVAAVLSINYAQHLLILWPEHLRLYERLFDDLAEVEHLIDRNKNLDQRSVLDFVRRKLSEKHKKPNLIVATRRLMTKCQALRVQIAEYLHDFEPHCAVERQPPNIDPISHEFIEQMTRAWREFRLPRQSTASGQKSGPLYLRREERRPFARLLAATWRDLGFPLTDHRERSREPLEEWFTVRLAARFSAPKPGHPDDQLSEPRRSPARRAL
jgi:hypothetical protein